MLCVVLVLGDDFVELFLIVYYCELDVVAEWGHDGLLLLRQSVLGVLWNVELRDVFVCIGTIGSDPILGVQA